MEGVPCRDCGEPIPLDEPSRPVRWTYKDGRRLRLGRGFVHAECRQHGHFKSANGYTSFWDPAWAGWLELPPAPCENCGRVVILTKDKRRRRTVCSPACGVAVAPSRQKAERESGCAVCGGDLGGRTDTVYCSSPCRQKAYRARKRTA